MCGSMTGCITLPTAFFKLFPFLTRDILFKAITKFPNLVICEDIQFRLATLVSSDNMHHCDKLHKSFKSIFTVVCHFDLKSLVKIIIKFCILVICKDTQLRLPVTTCHSVASFTTLPLVLPLNLESLVKIIKKVSCHLDFGYTCLLLLTSCITVWNIFRALCPFLI